MSRYRTGRKTGTLIYRDEEEQPCAFVPGDREFAARVVELLNSYERIVELVGDAKQAVTAAAADVAGDEVLGNVKPRDPCAPHGPMLRDLRGSLSNRSFNILRKGFNMNNDDLFFLIVKQIPWSHGLGLVSYTEITEALLNAGLPPKQLKKSDWWADAPANWKTGLALQTGLSSGTRSALSGRGRRSSALHLADNRETP